MAQMYPVKEDLAEVPYSEIRVYDLLSSLGENFTIFHSVQWVKRGSKWKSTWKENDFLVLNRNLGGLVLEVKGGDIECKGGPKFLVSKDPRTPNPRPSSMTSSSPSSTEAISEIRVLIRSSVSSSFLLLALISSAILVSSSSSLALSLRF